MAERSGAGKISLVADYSADEEPTSKFRKHKSSEKKVELIRSETGITPRPVH